MATENNEPAHQNAHVGAFKLTLRGVFVGLTGATASACAGTAFFGAIGTLIWLVAGDRNAFIALAAFGAAAGTVAYVVWMLVLWLFSEALREPTLPSSGWTHMVAAVAAWVSPFFYAAFKIGGSVFDIASHFSTPDARRQVRCAAAGALALATVVAIQLTIVAEVVDNPVDDMGRAIGMALITVAAAVGGLIGAFIGRR
jgi:hypothetical protein